jgi:hypothetical protein
MKGPMTKWVGASALAFTSSVVCGLIGRKREYFSNAFEYQVRRPELFFRNFIMEFSLALQLVSVSIILGEQKIHTLQDHFSSLHFLEGLSQLSQLELRT